MKECVARLYDTRSGFIRSVRTEHEDGFSDEDIDFLWTDGSYACDCNRSSLMYPGDDSMRRLCGETIELLSLTVDGRELLEKDYEEN